MNIPSGVDLAVVAGLVVMYDSVIYTPLLYLEETMITLLTVRWATENLVSLPAAIPPSTGPAAWHYLNPTSIFRYSFHKWLFGFHRA